MEFVYVTKRYDLFDLSFPHGFVAAQDDDRVARWNERITARSFFVERRWAEQDSSLKQIIPYTLVVHGNEVLLLKRLNTGGESRLHGKLSIGVGGHINPVDEEPAASTTVLEAGCRRELEEELHLDTPYSLQTVGVINDESGDVGSVHFGLVQVARCETADVRVREVDMMEGSFVSVPALKELAVAERDRLESWSAMIIDHIDAVLGAAGVGEGAHGAPKNTAGA
jgi:predicted NUDIX family phosphoesterase